MTVRIPKRNIDIKFTATEKIFASILSVKTVIAPVRDARNSNRAFHQFEKNGQPWGAVFLLKIKIR